MVLQAEAAVEVIDTQPVRSAQTLDAVGETGRQANGDLRHLLGILRSADDAGPADLDALIARSG